MPVIQKFVNDLAAGGVLENALAGSAFEFAPRNQVISIGVVANILGGFVTIQVGSQIVLEESPAVVKTTFPVIPDEMYYQDIAAQGDRIVVRLRNSAVGVMDFRIIVQSTNL